jgi:hypothetical protein
LKRNTERKNERDCFAVPLLFILILRFPKAVQIAIGISRFNLFSFAKRKARLGLFAGLELFPLIALVGADCYPFDIVFGYHGMNNFADSNGNYVTVNFNNLNMLFNSGVG